ncbi:signal peptidase I [Sutcliffiella horikoshii]|uniref:Signal peptidase I n=1 Tax=Sutcliffiella horikoshii TaxID=79883 RepID=A0AA95B5T8_9BACI|nr:signal peptidase I [Sutcliffiella horikoshii]TYS55874.1 signal peptidase I [Sutcliffiella horikoshii]
MRFGVFLIMLLVLMGCSFNSPSGTVSDNDTDVNVSIFKDVEPDWIEHHYLSDNMDRGNHDYYDQVLVIDPSLEPSSYTRGDIVFFSNSTNDKMISRIIALPGEKISISEGQIYINNQKLDTFYGKAHRLGLDKDSYFPAMDKAGVDYDKKGMLDYVFEFNQNELELADNEYYVVSDDWFRGTKQILKQDEIIGEVLGYQYGYNN